MTMDTRPAVNRPDVSYLAERREGRITSHDDVLSYFADGSATVAAIAEASALSPSTVRRYVNDLVAAGVLERFTLGAGRGAYYRLRSAR